MKELFLKTTIDYITKYKNYSNDEIEKLQYGLEGIYLTVTKIVFVLLISFFRNFKRNFICITIF